jgi:hypothetical protein
VALWPILLRGSRVISAGKRQRRRSALDEIDQLQADLIACECMHPKQRTLPDRYDTKAELPQLVFSANVAPHFLRNLVWPAVRRSIAAVAMPNTSMPVHDDVVVGEYEIWFAGESFNLLEESYSER